MQAHFRGEKLLDPKVEGRLRCRYVTNNVPFFFIQPVKMEEALLKPLLVIYHGVIFDAEIDVVKKLAQPRVGYSLNLIFKKKNKLCDISVIDNSSSEPVLLIETRVEVCQSSIVLPKPPF